MTTPTQNRILPRNRGVIPPEDRAAALRKARRAATLTRRMARRAEYVRERRQLINEANMLGLSRAELAKLIGVSPRIIDIAITDARKAPEA